MQVSARNAKADIEGDQECVVDGQHHKDLVPSLPDWAFAADDKWHRFLLAVLVNYRLTFFVNFHNFGFERRRESVHALLLSELIEFRLDYFYYFFRIPFGFNSCLWLIIWDRRCRRPPIIILFLALNFHFLFFVEIRLLEFQSLIALLHVIPCLLAFILRLRIWT